MRPVHPTSPQGWRWQLWREVTSYFPHKLICISCPISFAYKACWLKGFIASFPSIHAMQLGLGICISTSKPSTKFWSYNYCNPVYSIWPNHRCHASQLSISWAVNTWSLWTICLSIGIFSLNFILYRLFCIHVPVMTHFLLSKVSISFPLWTSNVLPIAFHLSREIKFFVFRDV